MAVPQDTDLFSLNLDAFTFTEMGGYVYFYKPDHPLASHNGMVAVHRHILSAHLGRWLEPDEMVLFVDGNRQNVALDNLKLTTRAELLRINANHPPKVTLICPHCENAFEVSPSQAIKRHYCSLECVRAVRRKLDVTREELERLVWEMPTTEVAKLFDVSGQAIAKRCKRFGIKKPPRGYWAKIQAGKMDPTVEEELKR